MEKTRNTVVPKELEKVCLSYGYFSMFLGNKMWQCHVQMYMYYRYESRLHFLFSAFLFGKRKLYISARCLF